MESEKGMGGTGTRKRVRYDSVQMRAQQEEEVGLLGVLIVVIGPANRITSQEPYHIPCRHTLLTHLIDIPY